MTDVKMDVNKLNNMFNFQSYDDNIYVYVRISTNKQDVGSQLFEINNYCLKERLYPKPENILVDENVSGNVEWRKRKLKIIMDKITKNDIIIVPEISRIGRNMNEVQEIMAICIKNNVKIRDIKNNFVLDGGFQSNIMATMYSMFAQMERQIISERVKQGMANMKAKGIPLKRGIKKNKLDGKESIIQDGFKQNKSLRSIAAELNINPGQLHKFIKNKNLKTESVN